MLHSLPRRIAITLVLASQLVGRAAMPSANACCLTDWLYGRQPAYAAGYPPVVGVTPGYSAAYPPTYTGPPNYTAGYTPLITAAPNSSVLPLTPSSIYTPSQSYSLQRPAYGAAPMDNPSVYTGLPVTTGSVSSGYRGIASTAGSFYGTGNIYPDNSIQQVGGSQPVTSMRPATGYPTPIRSGLSRFFNSLLGTGYRSSYYTAPITYYRPATTLDPVTGTTVTVQRACESSVQQLQRTPYTTFQGLASQPFVGQPAMGMAPSSCGTMPMPSSLPMSNAMPMTSPYAGSVTSIPSSIAPNGYAGIAQTSGSQPINPSNNLMPFRADQYSPQPLTGMPDNVAVDQPQIAPESFSDRRPSSQYRYSIEPPATTSTPPPSPAPEQDFGQRFQYQQNPPEQDSYDNDIYDSYRYQPEQDASEPEAREIAPTDESDLNALDEYLGRSRSQIDRDREDLRRLTSGQTTINGQTTADARQSLPPRVRPIPAPDNYRHPFATDQNGSSAVAAPTRPIPSLAPANTLQKPSTQPQRRLRAPDLLPALPPPSTGFPGSLNQAGNRPSTTYDSQLDRDEVQWTYKIREASLSERRPMPQPSMIPTKPRDSFTPVRQPAQTDRSLRARDSNRVAPQPPRKIVNPPTHRETGWHAIDR